MDHPRITLAIFGNQNSNSGFQPLYWINQPPQQLENLIPPGMEDNPYFFVLETGQQFTQYTLVQNHVSSYMSIRPGALKMAVAISNGYRLAGDASPLDVLLAVRETFVRECMTQKSSLSQTHNFKEVMVDEQVFKDILSTYTLEASYDPVYPMQGSDDALLLLSETQMTDFFRNVHYPELQRYRRVVIGEKGNPTVYAATITGLQIPLPMKPAPAPEHEHLQPQRTTLPQQRQPSQTLQLPQQPRERVYLDFEERPSIVKPIIMYAVMPMLAFLFGLLATFVASLIINKSTITI